VNSIDQLSGVRQLHSLSNAVFATRPTGVDEPAFCAVFSHIRCKHFSVDGGVEREESFSEAGGESCLRLNDSNFCTSNFGSVP